MQQEPGPKQPPRIHGEGCICGDHERSDCPVRSQKSNHGPHPVLLELVRKVDAAFYPIIATPSDHFRIGRDRFFYETLIVSAPTPEEACQIFWDRHFRPHVGEKSAFNPIFYRYSYKISIEWDGSGWTVRSRCYLDGVHGRREVECML